MQNYILIKKRSVRACLTIQNAWRISSLAIVSALFLTLTALAVPQNSRADYFDDIGYTALSSELGIATPTGSGVNISQIEALSFGAYAADPDHLELMGKTITEQSGQSSSFSFHANDVAKFLLGNNSGVAPGVTRIDAYEAVDWYGRILLRSDNAFLGAPLTETNRVQNHSWIANRQPGSSAANAIKILRLFDYAIVRDNIISVVSVSNDSAANVPDLLSHNYNGITVGTTVGSHSAGGTLFDGNGRAKPDIVAPFFSTSFAVPTVSGCASMLLEVIDDSPALEDAALPEAMKAILMAGATKEEFGGSWTNSPAAPLDSTYGAGELNILHSYNILASGEQDASINAEVSHRGWDVDTIAVGETNRYYFSAPEGFLLSDLSAMLVWNRVITDDDPGPAFNPATFLPDHDLTFFATDSFLPENQLAISQGTRDNLEHIHLTQLGIGQFMLSVTSATGGDYALAWRTTTERLPRISHIQVLNPTNTLITAEVNSGTTYELESTENLSNWTAITQDTSSNTILTMNDHRPTSDRRSYRIQQIN